MEPEKDSPKEEEFTSHSVGTFPTVGPATNMDMFASVNSPLSRDDDGHDVLSSPLHSERVESSLKKNEKKRKSAEP